MKERKKEKKRKKERIARWWWCTPLIPALGRQMQMDLCEFKVNLVYMSFKIVRAVNTEKPCLEIFFVWIQ